ncbi:fumarylacetoacetate hydrolase family protein [Halomicrobium salinisoli]|uniref:fumarylacetoacetate hydrolase family protein n=1 Tax=Halomicrobium salinisoli TaxID=2878391 RepID=UPI001CEFEEE7|nr:fumarylacetoacetate hydrolase family protein [Halomicrobium salinisoli]
MRYYRVATDGNVHLVAEDDAGAFDLTAANERIDSFTTLARCADVAGTSIDDLARRHREDAPDVDLTEADVRAPAKPPEVWAAGVTYEISEEAREEESDSPDLYMEVYRSERPELFLKSTPSRTVGPGEAVGVRGDSEWDVPEPELGVVVYDGDVVGYTIGNDVSSREIEGDNPLYLPQAKIYDRSCSIGPCIASTEEIDDPHELTMTMTIERDGEVLYEESADTGDMVHSCEELVSYLERHNELPELTVLLTGTALVPDDYTMQPGDDVAIEIEDVGTLTNGVVDV